MVEISNTSEKNLLSGLTKTELAGVEKASVVSHVEKNVQLPLMNLYYSEGKENSLIREILYDYLMTKKLVRDRSDFLRQTMDVIQEKLHVAEKSELAYLLAMATSLSPFEEFQLSNAGVHEPSQLLKKITQWYQIGEGKKTEFIAGKLQTYQKISPDKEAKMVDALDLMRREKMLARFRSFFKNSETDIHNPMQQVVARMLGDGSSTTLIGQEALGYASRHIARYPLTRDKDGLWHWEEETFPLLLKKKWAIEMSVFAYGYDGSGGEVIFKLLGHQGENYDIIGIYGEKGLVFTTVPENPVKIHGATLVFDERAKLLIKEGKVLMKAYGTRPEGFDEVGFVIATNLLWFGDNALSELSEQRVWMHNEFEYGKSDFSQFQGRSDGLERLESLASFEARNITGELMIWVDEKLYLDVTPEKIQEKAEALQQIQWSLSTLIWNITTSKKERGLLDNFVDTMYSDFLTDLHTSWELQKFLDPNQQKMQELLALERCLQTLKVLIESRSYLYFIQGWREKGTFAASKTDPRITLIPKFTAKQKIAKLSIHTPFIYHIGGIDG